MPSNRRPTFAICFAVLLLASGCASVRPKPIPDTESLWKLYEQAMIL